MSRARGALSIEDADRPSETGPGRIPVGTSTRSRQHHAMHSLDEIAAAHALVAPHIRRTPILAVDAQDFGLPPFEIVFKLEMLQRAGVFKTRGAFVNLLSRKVPAVGVVAASGGNHGAAVAYAAQRLGIAAHIFVPTISSAAKVARIRQYGAEIHIGGDRYTDAWRLSQAFARETGALEVHAFDEAETILGQATLARELEEQAGALDAVLCAVGGGGLVAGIASYFRSRVAVVGVEPEGAPTLTLARAAGAPVDSPQGSVAADSLAPARVGDRVFAVTEAHVGRVVLVTDEAIGAAQRALWDVCRVVVEPGAAAPSAAVLSRAFVPAVGARVAVVLSGANTGAVSL